jgi:hypothetical protein
MGSDQPSKAANGGETPGAGSGGEGEGAVPEISSQAVEVVGAVEVVDTSLDEALERKKQAVAAVDEVEKVKNRPKKEKLEEVDSEEFAREYVTIKNVLDIKDNPVYRAAFDEWNRQLKVLRTKLVDEKSEKAELTGQIYNIVGFFSVFQGVVLTAVSQVAAGSGEKCRITWVPGLLSVIATLAALFILHSKFGRLDTQKFEIEVDRGRINVSLYHLFHIVVDVRYLFLYVRSRDYWVNLRSVYTSI